jgi:hypothetical protein
MTCHSNVDAATGTPRVSLSWGRKPPASELVAADGALLVTARTHGVEWTPDVRLYSITG